MEECVILTPVAQSIAPACEAGLRQLEAKGYPGEDFAFCHRARQAGRKIMVDLSIRLWHIGQYAYGWEDAGSPQTRYQTYEFRLSPPSKEAPRCEIPWESLGFERQQSGAVYESKQLLTPDALTP